MALQHRRLLTISCRYRRVNSPSLSKVDGATTVNDATPVEMVTVPALGPEWKAEEMATANKKARREERAVRRDQKWKEWKRGERGLCGRYFTRKFTAWFVFALCVAYVASSRLRHRY